MSEEAEDLEAFRQRWRAEVANKTPAKTRETSSADASVPSSSLSSSGAPVAGEERVVPEKTKLVSILESVIGERQREREEAKTFIFEDVKVPSSSKKGKEAMGEDIPKRGGKEEEEEVSKADGFSKRDAYGEVGYSERAVPGHRPGGEDVMEILVSTFQGMDLTMRPTVEGGEIPIARLPADVLLHVMLVAAERDVRSFLRLTMVCRRFLLLSQSTYLWKTLCDRTFVDAKGSGRSEEEWAAYYGGRWRDMYIDRPRLRFNGVYICLCSYVREGWAENAWTQPIHLITYYRYLRFYPDGTAIKILTMQEPEGVVRTFDKDTPNVWQGTWEMDGPDQVVGAFKDPTRMRNTFLATVRIRGSGRGRHDKLRWTSFQILDDMDSYEPYSFSLEHFKTCYFSRVRFVPTVTE